MSDTWALAISKEASVGSISIGVDVLTNDNINFLDLDRIPIGIYHSLACTNATQVVVVGTPLKGTADGNLLATNTWVGDWTGLFGILRDFGINNSREANTVDTLISWWARLVLVTLLVAFAVRAD